MEPRGVVVDFCDPRYAGAHGGKSIGALMGGMVRTRCADLRRKRTARYDAGAGD